MPKPHAPLAPSSRFLVALLPASSAVGVAQEGDPVDDTGECEPRCTIDIEHVAAGPDAFSAHRGLHESVDGQTAYRFGSWCYNAFYREVVRRYGRTADL